MSKNPWQVVLSGLPLSETERAIVDRFNQNIDGKGFLPVADVLRSYDRHDEAIELMIQGVERHPDFVVARVVLSRDLMERGLVLDAWELLNDALSSIAHNTVAQRLRFKAAIVLSKYAEAESIRRVLTEEDMMDDSTTVIANNLAVEGLAKTRERIINEYESRGIYPVIPDNISVSKQNALNSLNITEVEPSPAATESTDEDGGFSVVELSKVFDSDENTPIFEGAIGIKSVELDSITLAEIFEKQQHYRKALDIYRRLLRAEPRNQILRTAVSRLKKQVSEQRDQDFTVDPAIADQMEQLEIIDCQMRFYGRLLNKLT